MSFNPASGNSSNSQAAVLVECSEGIPVVFSTTWYHTIDVPNFTICSRCFEDSIRNTTFASRFQGTFLPASTERLCLFNTERMRLLWANLVRNPNSYEGWDRVKAFMLHRTQIPHCQKMKGVKAGTPGFQWYLLKNADIPDFACCEACYEDIVCATSFADRFFKGQSNAISGDQVTVCDMSLKFIRRALLDQAPSQNWPVFVLWATARTGIPACNKLKSLKCSSTTWYMPLPPLYGVVVCGACFHDGVDLTPLATNFLQVDIPLNQRNEVWECANSNTNLGMVVAWIIACSKKNFSIWYNAAREIPNFPPCTKDGISNGIWYSIAGCPEFKMCGRCFAGVMQTNNFGHHFQIAAGPADGSAYVCDFFSGKNTRIMRYLEKTDEAVALGNFNIFHDFIARVSTMPPCPASSAESNRRWYCGDEATICESCYEEAIRGTSLANQLSLRERPDECICDAYSPRMRNIWASACAANDIGPFNTALRERAEVYARTVPRMKLILEMTKMRMATRNTMLMSSIMLQGGDNIVAAASANPTYSYGNSHMGYHWATPSGVQGAMQFQQAMNMNIAPTGDLVELAHLEALWKQYE